MHLQQGGRGHGHGGHGGRPAAHHGRHAPAAAGHGRAGQPGHVGHHAGHAQLQQPPPLPRPAHPAPAPARPPAAMQQQQQQPRPAPQHAPQQPAQGRAAAGAGAVPRARPGLGFARVTRTVYPIQRQDGQQEQEDQGATDRLTAWRCNCGSSLFSLVRKKRVVVVWGADWGGVEGKKSTNSFNLFFSRAILRNCKKVLQKSWQVEADIFLPEA